MDQHDATCCIMEDAQNEHVHFVLDRVATLKNICQMSTTLNPTLLHSMLQPMLRSFSPYFSSILTVYEGNTGEYWLMSKYNPKYNPSIFEGIGQNKQLVYGLLPAFYSKMRITREGILEYIFFFNLNITVNI